MQNHELKNPKNNNKTKTIPQNGVTITVYVESPKKQNNNSRKNLNPLKNINPNALPKPPKSRGYDRRAQLLAYSRHLRNVDSSSTTQSNKTNSKKWKSRGKSETAAARRTMRYERVGMVSEVRTEVVDQSCLPKCFHGSNNKRIAKLGSSIFRKLKSILGGLSECCNCKRSGDD